MRIAFSGVSSTGKTTLARAVFQSLQSKGFGFEGIVLIDEGMKDVYARYKVENGAVAPKFEQLPDWRKIEFQEDMIRHRVFKEFEHENFVGDGSPLDCAAFYIEWCTRAGIALNEGVRDLLYKSLYRHDLIFYCPFGRISIEDDQRRFTDRLFLQKMDYILQSLTRTVCTDNPLHIQPRIVKINTLSIPDRVQEVIRQVLLQVPASL